MIHNEVITPRAVAEILKRDYAKPTKFDCEQAYVMLNCWLNLMSDFNCRYTMQVKYYLEQYGVARTIADACAASDDIIRSRVDSDKIQLFRAIVLHLDMKDALQVLRFPKRFTFRDNPEMQKRSVSDFKQQMNLIKMFDRKGLPQWLVVRLQEVAHQLFRGYRMRGKVEIPSGAVAKPLDRRKPFTLAGKIHELMHWMPEIGQYNWVYDSGGKCLCDRYRVPFRDFMHRIAWPDDHDGYHPLEFWKGEELKFISTYNELKPVPKNYKTYRIIMMEEIDRQIRLGFIGNGITHCLHHSRGKYGSKGCINLDDQTRNQELARQGSITGDLSTIDITAASDSSSCSVVDAGTTRDLFKDLQTWRGNYSIIEGSRRVQYIYTTMGSRATFPLETALFWEIMCIARDILEKQGIATKKDDYSAYGDDLICPTIAYETIVDLLELCGFKVNTEKSFNTGHFRESCGSEWYNGIDVSSVYWPRKDLDCNTPDPKEMQSLIKFQHRVWSFPHLNDYLVSYLMTKRPGLTQAPVGEDTMSLWSSLPIIHDRTYDFSKNKHQVLYNKNGGKPGEKGYPACAGQRHEVKKTISGTKPGKTEKLQDADYDLIRYTQFLQYGPWYEEPLLELLGVSAPRPRENVELVPSLKGVWIPD